MSAALRGATKRFGSFTALDNVDLDIRDGEIHALLGANGSGKSTLVRTITGVYAPDAGSVIIGETDVTGGWSPAAAAAAGVRVVHQEAPLVDRLSIAESVALFAGYPRRAYGGIAWTQLRRSTQLLLDELHIDRSSRELAGRLTGAERAMLAVEIAVRTAGKQLRLLVLDEATAALPEGEASPFLKHVRSIADKGLPVLMVTHRLGELNVTDQVTVLDNGRVVYRRPSAEAERGAVVSIMRGTKAELPSRAEGEDGQRREKGVERLWASGPPRTTKASDPVLRVRGLVGTEILGLDLDLRSGEIVGVVGVRGGGLEELPRLLTGAEPAKGGVIEVGSRTLPRNFTPRVAIGHGLVHLPADRLREGGIATLPVADNVTLPDVTSFWHRRAQERRAVNEVISYLDVRPADSNAIFGRLSGGNQQKVILGRLLRLQPRVLVLADPTYGVDPAAREIMFDAIRDAGRGGVAVLLTSTEPEQLADLCDRVIVMRDGVVAETIAPPAMTAELLMTKAS